MNRLSTTKLKITIFIVVVLSGLMSFLMHQEAAGGSEKHVERAKVKVVRDWGSVPGDNTEFRIIYVNNGHCVEARYKNTNRGQTSPAISCVRGF
jgi:hypothetical protein